MKNQNLISISLRQGLALGLTLVLSWFLPLARGDDFPIGAVYPEAKASHYTGRILKFLEHWPPPTLNITDDRPFARAIRTPNFPDMIGMVKHFVIKIPIEKVSDAIDKFEEYPKIWADVLSVKVQSRTQNRTITEWTRKRPAFFMPLIQYRMITIKDKTIANRIIYRHQLIDGNTLNTSDSLVVLEKIPDEKTRISVVNFFDVALGAFKPLVGNSLWRRSMESSYKDDFEFKTHLENPSWSLDKASDAASDALDQNPIDPVQYTDLLKFEPKP